MHTGLVFCPLPLKRLSDQQRHAANHELLDCIALDAGTPRPSHKLSNVRLLRCKHDPDQARFALSGKMADVCQALDIMAARELA